MEKSPWDDISLYIEHRVICEVNCFDDETCIKKKKNTQALFYIQCDMQKLTVEELKRLLYDTFCDHLSMKDIENIIMTEESHIENPEDCQVDIDSKSLCLFTSIYFQCWPRD